MKSYPVAPGMYPPASAPYGSFYGQQGPTSTNRHIMHDFRQRMPMTSPSVPVMTPFSMPFSVSPNHQMHQRPTHRAHFHQSQPPHRSTPRVQQDRPPLSENQSVPTCERRPDDVTVPQIQILKNPAKEVQDGCEAVPVVQDAVKTSEQGDSGDASCESGTSLFVSKGKTPMCVVNEMARANKVLHQYHLTDETGPAHKKTFTVTLRLGMKADGSQKEGDVEEYVAQGASIKRAQHAAALMALEKTKFKKPEPKSERKSGMKLAPSVELNTLAMKLGESLSFRVNTPCQPLISNLFQYSPGHPPHILRSPVSVTLRVGNREYYGSGATIQGARHNAASKALVEFRERCAAKERETLNAAADLSAASVEKSVEKFEEILDYKSPISLLHEACIHHDLNVAFSVVNESGPPHLRIFVTRCTVSSIPNSAVSPSEGGQTKALVLPEPVSVEAEGNGKKTSKKKAAEEMLKTLIKTYPNILQGSTKPENVLKEKKCDPAGKATVKKKKMKIIKEQAGNVEYGEGINPISRLIQIQQSKKQKEPEYTLVNEKGQGHARKKEFVVQVTCGEFKCEGVGNNKKMAKRAAADALLVAMGYAKPMPVPDKPAIKKPADDNDEANEEEGGEVQEKRKQRGRKVTFDPKAKTSNDDAPRGAAAVAAAARGRQLMPGLLLMNPPSNATSANGHPPLNQALPANARKARTELTYLSSLMGFPVNFTDIPKTMNGVEEFVSLVTLPSWGASTGDGIFHGVASTVEEAQENAARQVLDAITRVGLSAVLPKPDTPVP